MIDFEKAFEKLRLIDFVAGSPSFDSQGFEVSRKQLPRDEFQLLFKEYLRIWYKAKGILT